MGNRKLKIGRFRKEYLSEQSIAYLTAGIFLLTYTDQVKDISLIFIIGIMACIYAFVLILVPNLFSKLSKKITNLNFGFILTPITFAALFVGTANDADKPYFTLRLSLVFAWAILWICFGMGNVYRNFPVKAKFKNNYQARFYRIFLTIEYFSIGMGYFMLINHFMNPESITPIVALRWSYNPLVYFGIGTLFLVPFTFLASKDDNSNSF